MNPFSKSEIQKSERISQDLARPPELQKVISYVETVPEGRALIALAKKMNCPIQYDSSLRKKGMYAMIRAEPSGNNFAISVDPSFSIPVQVSYLCHELRHLQQFSELQNIEKFFNLAPPLHRIALRFQEADAYVFQMHLAKKISLQTGLRIPFRSGSGNSPYELLSRNNSKTDDKEKSRLRIILKIIFNAPAILKLAVYIFSQKLQLGHLDPRERFREGVNPQALFRDFQFGLGGYVYDKVHDRIFDEAAETMPKSTLSALFNQKSFKGVVDFKKMCRLGVDEDTPSYLEGTEAANIRFVGKCIGKAKFKRDAGYTGIR